MEFSYFLWRNTKEKFGQKITDEEFTFDAKAIMVSLHNLFEKQISQASLDAIAAKRNDTET